MNTKYFYILLGIVLLIGACKKDDLSLFLNYDGNNSTSPTLPGGTYELAVKFPASETNDFIGNTLSRVDFYMTEETQFVRLKIYGAGNGNEPGNVIFSKDITREVKSGKWNKIDLADPIEITGEEIWISLRVTLSNQQQSVGCDAGPGHPEGSYVFLDDSDTWTTYDVWVGDSINWNIRGGLE